MSQSVIALRILHGILVIFFSMCLGYLYYSIVSGSYDELLKIAVISLGVEGILVFGFNRGDCPLIHIQKRVHDNKPFFELLLPKKLAKLAIPIFALLTLIPVIFIVAKYLFIIL